MDRRQLTVWTLLAAVVVGSGAAMIAPSRETAASAADESSAPMTRVQPADPATNDCPFTYYDLWEIQAEYNRASGIWVARTHAGPMGIDGGLSALRDC